MNKPSILKSVSVSEMLHLREVEGLSNREIANKIGCSYNTVNRHIGQAPFRKTRWDSRKDKLPPLKAPKRDLEALEPLKRMSFAERCEQALGKPEEHGIKAAVNGEKPASLPANPIDPFEPVARPAEPKMHFNYLTPPKEGWGGDEDEADIAPTEADVAREAHKKEIAQINMEVRSHTPELIAVFGAEAVRTWLKVSLYDMGIPDCRPMNREKMLEVLKIMNAGGAPA